ncbi:MAG: efflux RND transporter periplasmic adaptor subunit [Alphaproteobacteria bacterium]
MAAVLVRSALLAALGWLHASAAASADTLVVEVQTVRDYRPIFGTVESVKEASARTRIAGTLEQLDVVEGDDVEDDEEIARVVDPKLDEELAAVDASIRALEAERSLAEIELERVRELRRNNTVSVQRLDEARTNLDVTEQNLAARRAERAVIEEQESEGRVLAPAAGRVLQVPMTEGTNVQPGETVATIATADYVLRARLPERHARFLAEGDSVRIAERGLLTSDIVGEGTITQVYPELESGRVVADIRGSGLGSYFVGERVRLEVATGERRAVIVPPAYLDRRYGVTFARLEDGEEVVVQPGSEVDEGVEILAGLHAGDTLVAYED